MDIETLKPKEYDIITPEELTPAIQNVINRQREYYKFSGVSAEELSELVISFFGFNHRVLDNKLTPHERDVFYFLEDQGILGTEREETTLWDGRDWRLNYWIFKKDNIHYFAKEQIKPKPKKPFYEVLYNNIVTDEIWNMRPSIEVPA